MKNRNIPFGYCYKNGTIIIHPTESKIILDVCNAYIAGESLLKIADWLNQREIEYLPGIMGWNKARVKRLLEDKRYMGDDKYPTIVEEDIHIRIEEIKNGRNTQKSTNRESDIYKISVPILCSKCNSKMKRRFESQRKCKTRWLCENKDCKKSIDKDDDELLEDLVKIINMLIAHPNIIDTNVSQKIEFSQETIIMLNEIERLFEHPQTNGERIRKKIFEGVANKYNDIETDNYIMQQLILKLKSLEPTTMLPKEFFNEMAKAIILYEDKSIGLMLPNNQIVK